MQKGKLANNLEQWIHRSSLSIATRGSLSITDSLIDMQTRASGTRLRHMSNFVSMACLGNKLVAIPSAV